jgi:hypothetical protein
MDHGCLAGTSRFSQGFLENIALRISSSVLGNVICVTFPMDSRAIFVSARVSTQGDGLVAEWAVDLGLVNAFHRTPLELTEEEISRQNPRISSPLLSIHFCVRCRT